MPGGRKNTAFAVLERREKVARMYAQGMWQADIAARVGVSRGQVTQDLAVIIKVWQATLVSEVGRLKAEQLAKIDATEAAAWEGWHRSCEVARRKRAKLIRTDDGERTETQQDEEPQAGDPRFLQVVMSCVSERCKIIGAYAPTKIDLTLEQLESYSDEDLEAIATGSRQPVSPPAGTRQPVLPGDARPAGSDPPPAGAFPGGGVDP